MLSRSKVKPREKLVLNGAAALSDAELLAIFLRIGVTGKTAVELAEEMLLYFGGICQIMDCSLADFSKIRGLGLAKFAQLQAAGELVKRALNEEIKTKTSFSDPAVVDRFLLVNFELTPHERFAVLFLNSKNQLIKLEYLFNGSINSTQVYPRTIAQYCLKHNAASVIFAHNHPSGDIEPSQADKGLTNQLKKALALIDVKVLDHFIVGYGKTFSMAVNQMI